MVVGRGDEESELRFGVVAAVILVVFAALCALELRVGVTCDDVILIDP